MIKSSIICPPVVVNCMPKSGTHLIKNLFAQLPNYRSAGFSISAKTAYGKENSSSNYLVGVSDPRHMNEKDFEKLVGSLTNGTYVLGHVPYAVMTEKFFEAKKCKMIVLIRDPRDVACSFAFYFASKSDHYLYRYFSALENMDSRLEAVIRGIEPTRDNGNVYLKPLNEQFESILEWGGWKNSLIVQFEHLIGENGGGSVIEQGKTVDAIFSHLNIAVDEHEKNRIISGLYSTRSATFRRGLIGDYRTHFTPKIQELFEQHCGKVMKRFENIYSSSFAN